MRTTKHTIAVIVASTLALGSVTTLVGADWPSFRGPNHDGKSAETITWPKDGPKQLWKINVGIGHSAVSVVGDRAYTMGNTDDIDTIFSIDAATGKIVWKHSYPCNEKVGIKNYDGPFATPTVANGVVYTLSRKGDVFALDARDGKVIWAHNIMKEDDARQPGYGGFAGSPLILGDKLILNGSPGGMALDAKTGKTLWKSGVGPGGHATPVPFQMGEKTYLAIHSPRALTIVDAADGKQIWTTERRQPIGVNAPDPVIDGTKVFVTAGRAFGGALFDVSGSETKPLWEQEGLSSHWHTSVLAERVSVRTGRQQLRRRGPFAHLAAVSGLEDRRDQVDRTEARVQRFDCGRRQTARAHREGRSGPGRSISERLQGTWFGARHRDARLHRSGVRQWQGLRAQHGRRCRGLGHDWQVRMHQHLAGDI